MSRRSAAIAGSAAGITSTTRSWRSGLQGRADRWDTVWTIQAGDRVSILVARREQLRGSTSRGAEPAGCRLEVVGGDGYSEGAAASWPARRGAESWVGQGREHYRLQP